MTENDRQIEFKVGDRVTETKSGEKGTIARLCTDKTIIYLRWDSSKQQEMVEVSALKKE